MYTKGTNASRRPRAAVIVQVAVALTVLFGFAALTVDVGMMYNTRADLQVAADAAALAGTMHFISDTGQIIRMGNYDGDPATTTYSEVATAASGIANENYAYGGVRLSLEGADIVPGWFDFNNPTAPLQTGVPVSQYNAARVTVRRSEGTDNGPLDLLFAHVFGNDTANIAASAIAAYDDRFAAFVPQGDRTPLTPFVIQEDIFEHLVVNGPDNYGYDDDLGEIEYNGDGLSEISIYPYKQSGDGDGVGAGNFGLLNVGSGNHGTTEVADQILNGITPEDLELETGSSELTFYEDDGSPVTYEITGNPGMRTSLENEVEERIGDIIGFFLFSSLAGNGSNTTYTITGLRFGRVLDVELNGNPDNRMIVVQPATYASPEIATHGNAPGSGGLVGNLQLVR